MRLVLAHVRGGSRAGCSGFCGRPSSGWWIFGLGRVFEQLRTKRSQNLPSRFGPRPARPCQSGGRGCGGLAEDQIGGELDVVRVDRLTVAQAQGGAHGESAHLSQGLAHGGERWR